MKSVKIYGTGIEQEALDQFYGAMEMDFSIQGALLPDAHPGYALPIGAVVATKDCLVPAWVGYDQGCGVCALRTSFDAHEVRKHAEEIFHQVYRDVPVGFNHNHIDVPWEWERHPHTDWLHAMFKQRGGLRQLGTLGSGNHFIEIGVGTDEHVWIVVHSGSRGIGHTMAGHYMKTASLLNTGIDKAQEGHYPLYDTTEAGVDYMIDLAFTLDYALENRKEIMTRTFHAIARSIDPSAISHPDDYPMMINRNHNHAEYHKGLDAYIHRKGATHAEKGMLGVIPGNMRDGSYIVRGLGNPESLYSSSHGAGRVGSRRAARESINIEDFARQMAGIQALVSKNTLDEAPDAYKNFMEIMTLQSDLVEVVTHISPIINVKDPGGKKRKGGKP